MDPATHITTSRQTRMQNPWEVIGEEPYLKYLGDPLLKRIHNLRH